MTSVLDQPRRIEPEFFEKPWGTPRIEPWFESRGDLLTGEVWFRGESLLIKFLFTDQNLSVQVHPNDAYAAKHHNSRGKTEMWYILRADPGARIAMGFKTPIAREELIPAAKDGSIMDLLNWIDVHPGDTYYVPAGTVHAIGAGIALCEIQQYSDVTYRLYDYGRNRELHLDEARDVSDLGPGAVRSQPESLADGTQLLARSEFFRTRYATITAPRELTGRYLIVLEGGLKLNGIPAAPGQVWESSSKQWFVVPDSASVRVLLTE